MSPMKTRQLVAFLLGLVPLAPPAPAPAGTIAYQLQLSGDHNYPSMRLTNNSSSLSITRLDMTIGDVTYDFDSANQESYSTGITFTRVRPDANGSGGIR